MSIKTHCEIAELATLLCMQTVVRSTNTYSYEHNREPSSSIKKCVWPEKQSELWNYEGSIAAGRIVVDRDSVCQRINQII